MARLARLVIPGVPHHVTQRGNRRQEVFFGDEDYAAYLELLREYAGRAGLAIWAYCLMPNHIHLIAVPDETDSLRAGVAETHRRYTRRVNFREGWRGHLWQERFHSFAMDADYLYHAVRYVELNPVRAGLVDAPGAWPWSSAPARLGGAADPLLAPAPPLADYGPWAAYLHAGLHAGLHGGLHGGLDEDLLDRLRMNSRTGRPLGSDAFVEELERETGRILKPKGHGRPKKAARGGEHAVK